MAETSSALVNGMFNIATAATAGCMADFATFPLDTAKVRLQIQGVPAAAPMQLAGVGGHLHMPVAAQYEGLVGTLTTIARQEGVRSLYNGLSAGLQRQCAFVSVRLGMYESTKNFYQGLIDGNRPKRATEVPSMNVTSRVLAGLTTGGLAVLFAQPTDVVKVRFQAAPPGTKPYPSTLAAYRSIAGAEGFFGLWRGLAPNVARNSIVNVSEIVCYDIVKDALLMHGVMSDGVPLHFSSAVVAGFCATVVASPVDVVKTRYMNAKPGEYRSALEVATRMASNEGLAAFYKGFTPSFCRLVSWNIAMWITYEQLKGVVRRMREVEV
ncbi:mitochondrial uncoupling protein 2-like [Frankliniella occidentalis]|uniref:Mitochondrial uncoupling protein 2-like n=1 Tax=Frankliniella occidentalis TaxID=133901 RepID=A0A6J1RZ55_FRAOC|nr:mitochondrial uncoupling protein 2-like [Frankliniella occidentalis]